MSIIETRFLHAAPDAVDELQGRLEKIRRDAEKCKYRAESAMEEAGSAQAEAEALLKLAAQYEAIIAREQPPVRVR